MSMTATTSASAPRPTFFSEEMLRRAVACMMSDIVTPAAMRGAPSAPPLSRGRQLIAALHGIATLEQLVAYEEDLRATLGSREVSARGKIERLQASDECLLEQSYLLLQHEQAARRTIVREYTSTFVVPMRLISLAGNEERERLAICLEHRAATRIVSRLVAPLRAQLEESKERLHAEAIEALIRQELVQRRYMEIGERAQVAQLFCRKEQLERDAWMLSTTFLDAIRRLSASEAADRESLELMFHFHRSTLKTQEKESCRAALQASVKWISSPPRHE